jgi:YVTN family beta-propeller protein
LAMQTFNRFRVRRCLRPVLWIHLLLPSLLSVVPLCSQAQTAAQTAGPQVPPPAPHKSKEPREAIQTPVRTVPDPGIITTRQIIAPAGVQAIFESRVYGASFGEASDFVYVLATSHDRALVYKLDWRTNHAVEVTELPGYPGFQGMTFDPVKKAPLVTGTSVVKQKGGKSNEYVRIFSISNHQPTVVADRLGSEATGGVAISEDGDGAGRQIGVVPLTFDDAVAIVNLASGSLKWKVRTGVAPFGAVVSAAGGAAFVSNWGGRIPTGTDLVAATGSEETSDKAVVDTRGIAASGTVSRIDLATGKVTNDISVGLHPTGLAWDERRDRLYVANSNSDTIAVIDTLNLAVVATVELQPFERKVAGVAPESLVLSKDGRSLFAACAGINAIAVVNVADLAAPPKLEGLIPTAWYPNHIGISPDGNYLVVSTLLGVGSGWKNAPIDFFQETLGARPKLGPTRRYVHSYRGTVHVIAVPEADQLASYTVTVAEANHMRLAGLANPSESGVEGETRPLPVPRRSGEPSPIQHIVYIIKENRSYDQMLGDLGKGNGDPTLEVYGQDVAPNQRNLAKDFVLLDNFYATGGDSGDGHQWVTQASETDYTYWPGYNGRSYPKNGDDPLAYANSGFIWDNAVSHGKSFQDFGEFVGYIPKMQLKERVKLLEEYKSGADFGGRFSTVAPIVPLNKYVARDYPAYGLQCPDVVRARIFLQHLKQWEGSGAMPNLVMVQLPSDHTAGTTPGLNTPKAEIADNDWAVGRIVEGLSRSTFWKSMLIFVVEDDAQDGLDHVDGHRTLALAVSPYIRRGAIDSTFYSQPSMVKTIELILGLPTMSLFDFIANDMRNSFQAEPDFAPYAAVEPKQSINELNPPLHSLEGRARQDAEASARMNFLVPDAVPAERLNAILWRNAKGTGAKVPAPIRGWFQPYAGPSKHSSQNDRD